MYDAEDLMKVLKRSPFEPFTLKISTGETYSITHPEQAILTSRDGIILTSPSEKPGLHDWDIIGLDHVVGIQISETAN